MRSLFELQTKATIDLTIFSRMKEKAIDLLSNCDHGKYTQAIILFSSSEKVYEAVIKNALSEEMIDEVCLIQKIMNAENTEICYVLCMWHDKSIDIPSFAFRQLLLALNPKNSAASLFVMTTDGVSAVELSTTME